ncbi:TolC family protein [Granulicella sp. L46]|uniref:TolC family protein n=1 Tax=Granulicella sp. L46 TaxID=1641865 RepID=UPI00131C2F43|nr:TolC family protein [Granulicella sp. L46]
MRTDEMRVRMRWAMGWLILTAFAAGASAQISLGTAVDLALKNDPKVRMSEAAVEKAEAALEETKDVYVPTLSANAGYGQGFGVPTSLPIVFSLTSQSLVFSFSQHDNIRAAAAGLAAARFALKDVREQVEEDVAVTYLNLDSDRRALAVMAQEHGDASRLVTIVEDRLNAGHDDRMDLLQAQRKATQIELNELNLQDEIAQLSDHLSRLIGLPDDRLTAISTSIPALPNVQEAADNGNETDSPGVKAALAGAKSKQELSFGVNRYLLRPQMLFGVNYSRIDTGQNDYTHYYPFPPNASQNAVSVYVEFTIPIYDRRHQDEANEAKAEASRAYFESEAQRDQFLEGRKKLRRSAAELEKRSRLAEIDQDIAQEQLKTVLAQLSADSGSSSGPQLTPEDEQNARLKEGQQTIDLLTAQFQLSQAKVNLLRQTGQLEEWLKSAAAMSETAPTGSVTH